MRHASYLIRSNLIKMLKMRGGRAEPPNTNPVILQEKCSRENKMHHISFMGNAFKGRIWIGHASQFIASRFKSRLQSL